MSDMFAFSIRLETACQVHPSDCAVTIVRDYHMLIAPSEEAVQHMDGDVLQQFALGSLLRGRRVNTAVPPRVLRESRYKQ